MVTLNGGHETISQNGNAVYKEMVTKSTCYTGSGCKTQIPFYAKALGMFVLRASVRHTFSGYKPISFVWLTPAVGDTTFLFLTPFHLVLSFVLQDPNPA